jgi:hypothetical protein
VLGEHLYISESTATSASNALWATATPTRRYCLYSEALEHDEDPASRSLEISKNLSSRRASSSSRRPPPIASNSRALTNSQASGSVGKGAATDSFVQTTAGPLLASQDFQQRSLEHVVSSRLVETFLSLSIPCPNDLALHSNKEKKTPSLSNLHTSTIQATPRPTHKRSASSSTNSSSSTKRPVLASRRPSIRENQLSSSTTKADRSPNPSISKPIPRRAVAPPTAEETTQNALPTPAPSPPAVQIFGLPDVPFSFPRFIALRPIPRSQLSTRRMTSHHGPSLVSIGFVGLSGEEQMEITNGEGLVKARRRLGCHLRRVDGRLFASGM